METSVTILLVLLCFTLYGVVIYNRLVGLHNQSLAAWSDIDVQLKRRHDLIPKLVVAVRRYAAYEQSTLTAVTQLRSRSERIGEPAQKGRLESDLGQALQRLLAVAEAYPELQANQNFLALQRDISAIENDIQHARRYYNGAIRLLNTRLDSFPDLFVARLFGFRHGEYFQLGEEER
jgi:LemA protein